MHLPESAKHDKYRKDIAHIEHAIKTITQKGYDEHSFSHVQSQLDQVAETYQYDEALGTLRYKMYELQALIHYFLGRDDEALSFIDQAIDMRGESYPKAENMIAQIQDQPTTTATASTKHNKLVGLEGWLALYIVGLGITGIVTIISLLGYGSTLTDLNSIQDQDPGMYQSFQGIINYEIFYHLLIIALITTVIVLLAKHKKLARTFAIGYMTSLIVFPTIDYIWGSSLASAYNLDLSKELGEAGGEIGRNIIYAAIWIPYFFVSKRVKATLTK
jgi:hypothetical protein